MNSQTLTDLPLDDEPLWLELMKGTTWIKGKIISQSATGKVLVDLVDTGPEWVDLTSAEYRWIYTPKSGSTADSDAPPRRRMRSKTAEPVVQLESTVEGQGDS